MKTHLYNEAKISMQTKISVAVLGATGAVGQRFLELLENHPFFEVVAITASERSVGKKIGRHTVVSNSSSLPCQLLFSAMKASVAGEIEEKFARAGHTVISNARSHRWTKNVPLVIPEVNPEAIEIAEKQEWSGRIITNPNCVVIPLCASLKPLDDLFGIKSVKVVSMQAVSGAGASGVPGISDNVIPYIEGEQKKVETEPFKIMGWEPASVAMSAQCMRVPVSDGHTLAISFSLHDNPPLEHVQKALKEGRGLYLHHNPAYPQPSLHRNVADGMAIHVGQLEECPLLGYRMIVMAHNAIRGAAGNAIAVGHLLCKQPISLF